MSTHSVALDSAVRFRESVLFRQLEDEGVLLDLDSGRYFGLDEVGTRMWNLLREEGEAQAAADRLAAEYSAPSVRIEHDLLGLLEELASERLVEIV